MPNRVSIYEDTELLALLRQGNEEAFNEIYHRYGLALYRFVFKKLSSQEEAEDIIQELFTYLWDKRNEITIRESLSSYLFKAAYNRTLNVFKWEKNKAFYSDSFSQYLQQHSGLLPDEFLIEKELQELVSKEISQMPPQMRRVFELSREGHLSHKEIGESLGISSLTVRTQVKRALRILRTKVQLFIFLFL